MDYLVEPEIKQLNSVIAVEEPDLLDQLVAKIDARTAVIGIVGLGYFGLPLQEHAKLIVDTRGVYLNSRPNIVKS